MKLRKILPALLLCLCMALSLAACGGGGGSETPVPFSKLLSKGTHILYKSNSDDNVRKSSFPQAILLIENGKVSIVSRKLKVGGEELTFGKLSEMTDKEIIEAVHASPDVWEDCPYFLHMYTDDTGNTPITEKMRLYNRETGDSVSVSFSISGGRPVSRVVYDKEYTFYKPWAQMHSWGARGAGFTLDDLKTKGILIDPTRDDLDDMERSILEDLKK